MPEKTIYHIYVNDTPVYVNLDDEEFEDQMVYLRNFLELTNLDKDASLSIVRLLQQINELGTTVLLSTHDATILEKLKKHRQIELEKGKVKGVASGKKIVKESFADASDSKDKKDSKKAKSKNKKKESQGKDSQEKAVEKIEKKEKKSSFKLKIPFFSKKEGKDALEEALDKLEETEKK